MHKASHQAVVEALRAVASGREPDKAGAAAAADLGLLDGAQLTTPGKRLVEDGVLRKQAEVITEVLRDALLQQEPVRAFIEGEWGREMDRPHAREVLAYASPETRDWSDEDFGRFLLTLNAAGLVSYAKKTGRVVVLSSAPSGTPSPAGTLVSPSTPFRNKLMLAELVACAKKSLWWFDSHLDRKGLRFLWEEADLASLTEIRILTCGRSALEAATLDDYRRFKEELAARGVSVEWRTILDREELNEKHDRWLCPDGIWWNVPPFSAVMTGKYGSLLEDPNVLPFDEWWNSGTEILSVKAGA